MCKMEHVISLIALIIFTLCTIGRGEESEPEHAEEQGRIGANGKAVTIVKNIRMALLFPHNSELKHLIGNTVEYASSGNWANS